VEWLMAQNNPRADLTPGLISIDPLLMKNQK
jgi:hypothetical protein